VELPTTELVEGFVVIVPASTTSLATDCSAVGVIVSTGVEISVSPTVSLI